MQQPIIIDITPSSLIVQRFLAYSALRSRTLFTRGPLQALTTSYKLSFYLT